MVPHPLLGNFCRFCRFCGTRVPAPSMRLLKTKKGVPPKKNTVASCIYDVPDFRSPFRHLFRPCSRRCLAHLIIPHGLLRLATGLVFSNSAFPSLHHSRCFPQVVTQGSVAKFKHRSHGRIASHSNFKRFRREHLECCARQPDLIVCRECATSRRTIECTRANHFLLPVPIRCLLDTQSYRSLGDVGVTLVLPTGNISSAQ
jgi:hypothetical protein